MKITTRCVILSFPILFTLSFAIAVLLSFPARAFPGKEKMILKFAFSSLFLTQSNRSDTRAAMEIWLRKLGEKKGYAVDSEVKFYDTLDALDAALVRGEITCIGMMMIDFVKLKHRNLVQPVLSYYKNNSPYETFLLVAHRESGIKSLKNLKKKQIIVERGKKTFMPFYWLETIVMEDTLSLPQDFFGGIEMQDSPLKASIPLYFKKTDACVISRSSFNVLGEMNPHYEKSFVILRESPPLAMNMVCLSTAFPEKQKEDFVSVGCAMDGEVEGQQILMLFQFDRLIHFKNEYMQSSYELVKKHDSLMKALQKKH